MFLQKKHNKKVDIIVNARQTIYIQIKSEGLEILVAKKL